jgi:methylmalonyl-CoA mutase N-terminal domain/subunit
MARVQEQGGMVPAIESGYVKRQLVSSHTERMRAIERGDLKIVGLNCYRETEVSPLTGGVDSGIMKVDPRAEREQIERLNAFRAKRNATEVKAALANLARDRPQRRQYHAGVDSVRSCRRHHRRVVANFARHFRRIPRAHRHRYSR